MSYMREFSPRQLHREIQVLHSRLYAASNDKLKFPSDERNFYFADSQKMLESMLADLHGSIPSSPTSRLQAILLGLSEIEKCLFGDTTCEQTDPTLQDLISYAKEIDKRLYVSESSFFLKFW